MIDRQWVSRRAVALGLLIPGYIVGWVCARTIPVLVPWEGWTTVSPYTVGAVASTTFNLVLWDRFVTLVLRFGADQAPAEVPSSLSGN